MGLSQANVAQLVTLREKINKLFTDACVLLPRFAEVATEGGIPDERDVTDGAYLCKLMSEMLDDLRKECDRASKAGAQWACEQHVIKQLSGQAKDDKIRAQLCTATTKITMVPTVPKRGSLEYAQCCLALGMTEEALATDAFHIHWPGFVALCSSRLAEGQELPKGVDKFTVKTSRGLEFAVEQDSSLSFRKAKDL